MIDTKQSTPLAVDNPEIAVIGLSLKTSYTILQNRRFFAHFAVPLSRNSSDQVLWEEET